MQINLLGEFEVLGHSRTLTPSAAKPRQVLAMLALNAGSLVGTEQLIDELWPDRPPPSAKTTTQTYVYQLRKILTRNYVPPQGGDTLITRPAGYVLDLPRLAVDAFRFRHLMDDGRAALSKGDPALASDLLRDALSLWRGLTLADVVRGPRLQGHSAYLEEQRIEALSLRIDADLETKRHSEIIGELRWLVTTHRLHEGLYIRLMKALHHLGRRSDALDVYQQLRRLLADELGLEPSSDAKRLQYQILAS